MKTRLSGRASFTPLGVTAPKVERVPRAALVGGCRTFHARDGLVVAVPEAIVRRLLAFATTSAPNEWFGFVASTRFEDADGSYVVVQGIVPDTGAVRHTMSVRTTPASEYRSRSLLLATYPDAGPGGWVHSHPNMGLTFSNQDRENQATWTDRDSLGIVVDPWSESELAVYRGPHSELLSACEQPCAERDRRPSLIALPVNTSNQMMLPCRSAVDHDRANDTDSRAETIAVAAHGDAPATATEPPRADEPNPAVSVESAPERAIPIVLDAAPDVPRRSRRDRFPLGPFIVAWITAVIGILCALRGERHAAAREERLRVLEDVVREQADQIVDIANRNTAFLRAMCSEGPVDAGIDPPAWCPTDLL